MLLKNTKLYKTLTEMTFFTFMLQCYAGYYESLLEGETFNTVINGV